MPLARLILRLLDLLVIAPRASRRYLVGPLPPTGPLVVASNRSSFLVGVAVAAAVTRAGRTPRFVDHLSPGAAEAARKAAREAAREALSRGECVVYPAEELGPLLAELQAPVAPVAHCVVAGRLLLPRRGRVVVTSPPVIAPPVDPGRVTAAVRAEVSRLREILDELVSAPARRARPARHPRRGDGRS